MRPILKLEKHLKFNRERYINFTHIFENTPFDQSEIETLYKKEQLHDCQKTHEFTKSILIITFSFTQFFF